MMTKKLIPILILLISFTFASASAGGIVEFENTGKNQYKKIRLFSDIYQNSDMESLRIKDEKGKNIPYFINSGMTEKETGKANYKMSLINSYLKDDLFYFDYKLSEEFKEDIISTGLSFTTSSNNFAKSVTVYGGYDNRNWEFVTGSVIYKIDNKSMLDIKFPEECKYTHFRLELQNNAEKIAFDTAELIFNETRFLEERFVNSVNPKFEVSAEDKKTQIKISGMTNLRLKDITVVTDSIFKRMASAGNISKEIYNLNFNGMPYNDKTLNLSGYVEKEDLLTLIIENGDDEPIEIKGILAEYYVDELIFEAVGNVTLELDYGLEKPQYDIVKYSDDILKQQIDELKFLGTSFTEAPLPQKEQDYTQWFNITVIAVAAILAIVFLLKLKGSKDK